MRGMRAVVICFLAALILAWTLLFAGTAMANPTVVCCPKGGTVSETYEGPGTIYLDGIQLSDGQGLSNLQPNTPYWIDASANDNFQSWASTAGAFGSTFNSQTTYSPGTSNGYIYLVSNNGQSNWAGYVFGGGQYDAASVTITLPQQSSFSGSSGDIVGFWVGLGGSWQTPVYPFWQAGVSVDMPSTVEVWYEAFQSATNYQLQQTVANAPMTFGDEITITLSFDSQGGQVCYYIGSWNQCETDTLLAGDTSTSSSEWIAEAPEISGGDGWGNLPDFSPVSFTGLSTSLLTGGLQETEADVNQYMQPSDFVTGSFAQGFQDSYSGTP